MTERVHADSVLKRSSRERPGAQAIEQLARSSSQLWQASSYAEDDDAIPALSPKQQTATRNNHPVDALSGSSEFAEDHVVYVEKLDGDRVQQIVWFVPRWCPK